MNLMIKCENYIDFCNSYENENKANKNIYEICWAYLMDYNTKKEKIKLINFFNI